MKAFTNTDLIETRAKWAKRIAPVTMLFLVGGLITNFMSFSQPEYFQWTVVLLAIGFFMSIISSSMVNNWVKEPRADTALQTALKKFGNDFLLFNYTSVANHILLTPSRLYVVITKRHDGEIRANGRKISRKFTFMRVLRFFADEGLGAPIVDAESQAQKLENLLHTHFDEETVPEVKSLVVFLNKDVNLIREDPEIPVLTASELKLHLRENDKAKLISGTTRTQLLKILGNDYANGK